VTSACIPFLKKLPALHTLTYNKHLLAPTLVAALRKALPHCRIDDGQGDVDMNLFAPLH